MRSQGILEKGGMDYVILTEGKGSGYGGVCVDHRFDRNCSNYRSHHSWNPNFAGLQPHYIILEDYLSIAMLDKKTVSYRGSLFVISTAHTRNVLLCKY